MVNVQHEKTSELRPTAQSEGVARVASPTSSEPQSPNEANSARQSAAMKMIVSLAVIVLSTLVFACFGRTLSSYFLADDFSEIWYVCEIFKGNMDFLRSTLAGNYMNVPGMSVWRPFLLTSLMTDYAVWGTDARGYYLTNLLYFAGDVLLLYFVTRELLASWTGWRRELASFFAGALFAVSPLHCESISWVVGRVDIISCFYYLASLLLVLRSRNSAGTKKRLLTAFSIACFWVGLLTKEMAIGLPAIVALIGFLFPTNQSGAGLSSQSGDRGTGQSGVPSSGQLGFNLRARMLEALRLSLPLWLSVIIYFPLRFLVLGTFVGGYVDGFGSAQMALMVQKWLDPETIGRFILPLNLAVFGRENIYAKVLTATYLVATAAIVARALLLGLPWRWLVFLLGWAATAAVPIFQLWGLGENLEGSRFYFYLTLPVSLLLPILLLAPVGEPQEKVLARQNFKLSVVGSLSLLLLTATLFGAAYKSNLVWVHAGTEVRAFWESCKQLASTASQETRFVILGIPKEHFGAHQILNGPTFSTMLDAPFTTRKLTRSFLTFDPIMYGAAEKINDTRFKECLSQPGAKGPLVWNGTTKSFVQVPLSAASSPTSRELLPADKQSAHLSAHIRGQATCRLEGGKLVLEHVQPGDSLVLSGLDVNPLDCDFLRVGMKYKNVLGQPEIKATWNGDPLNKAQTLLSPETSDQFVAATVHLSHYWRWYSAPKISELAVELFPCERVEIGTVTLVPAREVMPSIHVAQSQSSPAGVYRVPEAGFLDLVVEPVLGSNSKSQAASSSTLIEISKPNYFFVNFANDQQATAVATKVLLEPGRTKYRLYSGTLNGKGFYDVRCRTMNYDGSPASEYSNSVTVSSQYH